MREDFLGGFGIIKFVLFIQKTGTRCARTQERFRVQSGRLECAGYDLCGLGHICLLRKYSNV